VTGGTQLDVLAPLAMEALALRWSPTSARVHRVGGAARASPWLASGRPASRSAAVIAGFCGALADGLMPGDVVLATELWGGDHTVVLDDPSILGGVLRRGGLTVHTGPIASDRRLLAGARRRALGRDGPLAVDSQSASLAAVVSGRPLAVLRVVANAPGAGLLRPVRTARGAAAALRALRHAASLLEEWAVAAGPRHVMLAAPRASCAGVERAIETVRRTLTARDESVYVRRQVVHNAHVIAQLEQDGARFVEELDQVPAGATVIFSAHGVAPAVRREAAERELAVIDATCPLVAKVHSEARRFAESGYDIILVGHRDHDEVEGTFGEAPDHTHIVTRVGDIEHLNVADPDRVACLTQTTLAVDDTREVVDALRRRFPRLVTPRASDICYATQNRQDAVRALARDCDLILVIGSANSSNSRRLVEVAERAGCHALLVEDAGAVPPAPLTGVRRVGLSAGASAPEHVVQGVVRALAGLGPVAVSQRTVRDERVRFKLPPLPAP
jgi:4-hydroxy-3-methylbut-2-enyl diphosphate reductase